MNNIHGWMEMYMERFPNLHAYIKHPDDIHKSTDDAIFLVTDDDPSLSIEWKQSNARRLICINHCSTYRIPGLRYYIGTRYFCNSPSMKWALPCWNIVDMQDKLKSVKQHDDGQVHLAFVGSGNIPYTYDDITKHFNNADGITFHIINRNIPSKLSKTNIHYYENTDVFTMISVLSACHFVFCDPTHPLQTAKEKDVMSAAVPLAFGTRCVLIMSKSWANFYCLRSPLRLTTMPMHISVDMFHANVHQVDKEFLELQRHRNNIFSDLMNEIFNSMKN